MTHSPPMIMGQLLFDKGVASLTAGADWTVTVNNMPPDGPDKRIAIYATFSRTDGSIMETGQTITHPGIQIVVRGTKDDAVVYSKAIAIQGALDSIKKTSVTIGGDTYILKAFETINPPFFLKQEELNLRRFYIINGYITYAEVN